MVGTVERDAITSLFWLSVGFFVAISFVEKGLVTRCTVGTVNVDAMMLLFSILSWNWSPDVLMGPLKFLDAMMLLLSVLFCDLLWEGNRRPLFLCDSEYTGTWKNAVYRVRIRESSEEEGFSTFS